jgi:tungstate transport system substrate-binding protein
MSFKHTLQSFGFALILPLASLAQAESILVQSTTSTQNSGLYDHLLPIVQKDLGLTVNVVAVGTGQAIKNAENCDGDVLLVHSKASEEKFVSAGFGVERFDLMYNDFIVVGPGNDPAGINGSNDIAASLTTIATKKALFASRGDDSGTHKAELRLWKVANTDPTKGSGDWYRETGSGMGATLNAAIGMGAYAMTDRATWTKFGNKGDFKIHVEGDERLFNQYGVILINSEKCPSVKSAAGQQFVNWLISDVGQTAIASYKVNGDQLFFPNAK